MPYIYDKDSSTIEVGNIVQVPEDPVRYIPEFVGLVSFADSQNDEVHVADSYGYDFICEPGNIRVLEVNEVRALPPEIIKDIKKVALSEGIKISVSL